MARDTLSRHEPQDEHSSIEFLAPNVGAFGGTDVVDFVGFDGIDDPVFDDEVEPRSPWLGFVASIVVVGLLGAGIIAAAPWSDDASTAPTTTVPTPTTRPAPTTTERVIDVAAAGPPGFVLDDPSLQLSGAWTVGAEYRPAGTYGNDHFDLWSAPGATRTSGQWLAVAARHAELGYEPTNAGATRVPVGDRVALVTGRADGAVNITYTSADEITFEVEGFGFALGDMLAIATDLQHGDDGLITYGPMASPLLAGTVQQVSQQVPYGSFGAVTSMWQPRAGAYYQGDDYQTSIEVLLGDSSNSQAALEFLAPPVQLGVADQQVVDALARQGRAITVREVKNWPGALMATWRFPNESLQMQSYGMTVSELVAAAATARLADPLEWATIIDKSNHGELNVDLPVTQAQPTLIGERDEASDPLYRVEMMAGTPAMVFLSAERTGWGGPLGDIATEPSVHQFASPSTTFLVLTTEWPNTIRRARVTVEGLEPVELVLVQVGDSPVYAAGFAYNELAPATVEFLTADGTVVVLPD